MELSKLGLNRFLQRSPQQTAKTDGSQFMSSNPASPATGSLMEFRIGQEDAGAKDGSKNVLTGTVITSCFIQTSALPSRIELEGNDLTFYDNTYEENGQVIGDTSRLVFTHDLNSGEGYIMEKRASIYNTYDNVLSWFATPAKEGAHNYMFIGRNAYVNDDQRNVHSMHFNVNKDTSFAYDASTVALNGVFEIEYSEDGVLAAANYKPFFAGNSKAVSPSLDGFSAVITAGDGGVSGLGYISGAAINLLLYLLSDTTITLGANLIPDTNNTYNIGGVGAKINTIYRTSEVACPLPTVPNALEILEKIPAPTMDVGDRGHFGENRLYFDDLTFPDEIALKNEDGTNDIEMTRTIGFLLKVVVEMNQQIKDLQSRLP